MVGLYHTRQIGRLQAGLSAIAPDAGEGALDFGLVEREKPAHRLQLRHDPLLLGLRRQGGEPMSN